MPIFRYTTGFTTPIHVGPGRLHYPSSFSYEDAIAASMRRTTPETLTQVIQRLHRRQQFYLTHKKDLPSW